MKNPAQKLRCDFYRTLLEIFDPHYKSFPVVLAENAAEAAGKIQGKDVPNTDLSHLERVWRAVRCGGTIDLLTAFVKRLYTNLIALHGTTAGRLRRTFRMYFGYLLPLLG